MTCTIDACTAHRSATNSHGDRRLRLVHAGVTPALHGQCGPSSTRCPWCSTSLSQQPWRVGACRDCRAASQPSSAAPSHFSDASTDGGLVEHEHRRSTRARISALCRSPATAATRGPTSVLMPSGKVSSQSRRSSTSIDHRDRPAKVGMRTKVRRNCPIEQERLLWHDGEPSRRSA